MKNILACLGAILLVAILAVGGCAVWGYTVYKKMEGELPAIDAEVKTCVGLYNDGHYAELYDRGTDGFRSSFGTRAQCVDQLTALKTQVGLLVLGERNDFNWQSRNDTSTVTETWHAKGAKGAVTVTTAVSKGDGWKIAQFEVK